MPGKGMGLADSTPVNASSGLGGRYGGKSSDAKGRGGGGCTGRGGAFCRRCRLASGWPRSDEGEVAGFLLIVKMASGGRPTCVQTVEKASKSEKRPPTACSPGDDSYQGSETAADPLQ